MRKLNLSIMALMIVAFIVACAIDSGSDDDDGTGDSTLSDTKEITAFLFEAANNPELDTDETTDITGSLITAEVPFGVDMTDLVATFTTTGETVTVDAVTQESGVSANNFSDDVTYTVTAEDDSTASYIVSVSQAAHVWSQSTILRASDAAEGDKFGTYVAIDGDTAVIGASIADSTDDVYLDIGALYVMERDTDGNWAESDILFVSNPDEEKQFPNSIAISGNTIIAGDATQNYDGKEERGVAYIFEKETDGSWSQRIISLESGANSFDKYENYGISVDIDGNTAVIGSQYAGADAQGRAYIYETSGDWPEHQVIFSSDAGSGSNYDQFGASVAISGDWIIVGANWEDGGEGDPFSKAGAAYIFKRNSDTDQWEEQAILHASDKGEIDNFGCRVDIDGDYALVYASGAGANDIGKLYVFHRESDTVWSETQAFDVEELGGNSMSRLSFDIDGNGLVIGDPGYDYTAGKMEVYQLSDGSWQLSSTHQASNAQQSDGFGSSVALDGVTIFIGSSGEDGEADDASNSGAVYVFE